LDEGDIKQIIEKNKYDPLFRGTLNQLSIFEQLKQHLNNEIQRYRSIGQVEIANFIAYSMAHSPKDC
jgi:hypothetical protein